MNDAPLLDLIEARKAAASAAWAGAEDGAQRAADHAEDENPGWQDAALDYVLKVARLRPDAPFMIEDVREFAEAQGLPPPPDARAWGAVALKAKRAKIIVRDGFGFTTRGPAHAHPRSVWRAAA
jgi:hypothetical protein